MLLEKIGYLHRVRQQDRQALQYQLAKLEREVDILKRRLAAIENTDIPEISHRLQMTEDCLGIVDC